MKKAFLCALIVVLAFCFFGCKSEYLPNIEESTTAVQTASEANDTENIVSLESACGAGDIDLDADYVEISVYSDSNYCFSNRNEDFYLSLTEFLENTKLNSVQADTTDDEDYYYVSINENGNHASFSVYDTDIISIVDLAKTDMYYSKGIYDSFENMFGAFFEENNKYYSSKASYDRSNGDVSVCVGYEYSVFDKNNNLLESDSTTKTPHIFYDSGIVHLWIQTGTGTLTRFARFYDVKDGRKSPEYYGQTDWFLNMVISTGHSEVVIYDMFSGDELYCINEFEKPLGDCIENIQSAYFSKDGEQIIVKYINEEYKTETQIITFPQETHN